MLMLKLKMKDEKQEAYAEIMHMFRYHYKHEWAPESIFDGKSRIWIQSFNELIKKGFINRRKKDVGYQYKWVAAWPEWY